MQPININVHVEIGVTAGLMNLLQPLINNKPNGWSEAPTVEPKKPATTEQPKVEEPAPAPAEPQPAPEPQEPAPANPPTEAAPAEQPAAAKEFTEVDVRAAMDRTRQRIEGEDYKTNTDGELRKKWHRALTGWFKQTAALLGSDKPSELPNSEARASFIDQCDRVIIENDQITLPIPF